jgi:hypothetical protein
MKSTRSLISIVLLFAATTAVFAQIESRPLMKVSIPFSFSAANHTLPAGQYLVTTVTPEHTIALINADGKHATIINDLPNYAGSPSANSRLVFQRYGDEYFLTQVWCKGDNVERSPMVSKRQSEVARNGGRADTKIILAYAGK